MYKDIRIFLIFSVVLIDIIGIGIIFPIIPDLLNDVGILNNSNAALWAGLLASSYAFMQFVFSPSIGVLSDIFGRRPILLIALLLLFIDYVIMGLASSIVLLFVGRLVAGVAGGTVTTATAYLADISEPQMKKKNFAIIGAAFGLGFILGPSIGGILGEFNVRAPFFISAAFALSNFFLCYFFLPESIDRRKINNFKLESLNPFSSILKITKIKSIRKIFFCFFLIAFANTVYPAVWSFWGKEVFGWGSGMIGTSLACYGFLLFIVQAFVIRLNYIDKLSTRILSTISMVLGIVAFVSLGLVESEIIVFFILPIAAMSEMVNPSIKAYMSNETSDDNQGLLQGILSSLVGLTSILGPILMTAIFNYSTTAGTRLSLPGMPFLFAAILFILSLTILNITLRSKKVS